MEPSKPGAGVKVKVPSGRTTSVPAAAPVSGSVMVTGVVLGASGDLTPGKLKLVTRADIPDINLALESKLPLMSVPSLVNASFASDNGVLPPENMRSQ